jgi:L-ascorbate metabolism protein UlaG (beta-lactamase superfamily)
MDEISAKISFSKTVIILFSVLTTCLFAQHSDQPTITWYGHSCFLITTSQNTKILTDPVDKWNCCIPKDCIPDVVTVSHNHADHNAVKAVSGKPKLIFGIDKNGRQPFQKFVQADENVKDVKIYNVSSNHFPPKHSPALNSIFIFEFDGIRIAHLGDIGLVMTEAQVKKIGPIDILMIPVGGEYTVSLAEVDKIIMQLRPRMAVIPMHYKTDTIHFLPHSVDDFIRGKDNVERIAGNTYRIDLTNRGESMKYIILNIK